MMAIGRHIQEGFAVPLRAAPVAEYGRTVGICVVGNLLFRHRVELSLGSPLVAGKTLRGSAGPGHLCIWSADIAKTVFVAVAVTVSAVTGAVPRQSLAGEVLGIGHVAGVGSSGTIIGECCELYDQGVFAGTGRMGERICIRKVICVAFCAACAVSAEI